MSAMQFTMIVSNDDPEIMWNAFRFANLMLNQMDDVFLFLNGPAVDYQKGDCAQFPLAELAKTFALSEGVLRA